MTKQYIVAIETRLRGTEQWKVERIPVSAPDAEAAQDLAILAVELREQFTQHRYVKSVVARSSLDGLPQQLDRYGPIALN